MSPSPRPLDRGCIEVLQYLSLQAYPTMTQLIEENIDKDVRPIVWVIINQLKRSGLVSVITFRNGSSAIEITQQGKEALSEEINFARNNGSG